MAKFPDHVRSILERFIAAGWLSSANIIENENAMATSTFEFSKEAGEKLILLGVILNELEKAGELTEKEFSFLRIQAYKALFARVEEEKDKGSPPRF